MKKYISLFLALLLALSVCVPALAASEEPLATPVQDMAAETEGAQNEAAEPEPSATPEAPAITETPAPTETPEAPAETAAPEAPAETEATEPGDAAAEILAAKDALVEESAPRPRSDGDSASTCTVTYYDPSGTTIIHSEEVPVGGMPDALAGPYYNGSLIIYWSTKANLDLFVDADWDYLCRPAFRSVTADTSYYAVYAPQVDGIVNAAFYVDDSWKLDGGTGKFFTFDWFPVNLYETSRIDWEYVQDYLRYMVFDAEDDFGGVHELYMSISWYKNSALSGNPVDPASVSLSSDTVFYGTMNGEYWFVYFLDENGDLAEAYPIEEGHTIANYPGEGKSVPIGAYWEDQNGNVYTAAEIKSLAIVEDLTLTPSQGPNGEVSPLELAQSLIGESADKLRQAVGEPLSSEYHYQTFEPTGNKTGEFTSYLYYDGFAVMTRKSDGFIDPEKEYVIWAKELYTVSFYADRDSSPIFTQEVPSGNEWTFTPETRRVNGQVVQTWTAADGSAVDSITADTDLYPVFAEREDGCWQVCFLSSDGARDILGLVNLPKGEKLLAEDLPEGAYHWYSGADRSGTKYDDLTALEINADTIFYGYYPSSGSIVFAREGGEQILSWLTPLIATPGDSWSVPLSSFFDGYYDKYGNRTEEDIAAYAWKNEDGEIVATVINKDGKTDWDFFAVTLTAENQTFYAVEGWRIDYYNSSSYSPAAYEVVAKNAPAENAPTELSNRPVLGWVDENGEAVDLSQPITGHRAWTAICGKYLFYIDPQSSATIAKEACASGTLPRNPAPTSYNGKTITGWYNWEGLFADPAQTYAGNSLFAWYGLRLPADNGKAYINGMGDDTFAPQNSLTRAQAANILYKLLGVTEKGSQPCSFTDVKSTAWYYDAVTVLASHGILTGYADSETSTYYFSPNKAVTRAEFVAMIARLFPERTTGNGVGGFNDVSMTHWFCKAVSTAARNGWITGYKRTDGTFWFQPHNSITRAEAVTIINRVLGRSLTDEEYSVLRMPFTDVSSSNWAYAQILAASTDLPRD